MACPSHNLYQRQDHHRKKHKPHKEIVKGNSKKHNAETRHQFPKCSIPKSSAKSPINSETTQVIRSLSLTPSSFTSSTARGALAAHSHATRAALSTHGHSRCRKRSSNRGLVAKTARVGDTQGIAHVFGILSWSSGEGDVFALVIRDGHSLEHLAQPTRFVKVSSWLV